MKDPRNILEVVVDTVNHTAQRGESLEMQVIKNPAGGKPQILLLVYGDKPVSPVILSDYLPDTLKELNAGTEASGRAGLANWEEVCQGVFNHLRRFAKAAGRSVRVVGL